ncbi:DUF481 domain-containing protein [Acidithiobacillus ferrianus]|uniref:DUF481 domain-containing protein n=2 Tax=Acidithiobacillus ferrianus TaxID=2678518 RepID=A0A845UDA7_9PROT|nr:DUF481 domain-containing protein [Acidithiobacillus ferrianus]NDU43941.1 DUF481 domain-containing protein [Acidithiobacillus ferrianus]
MRWSEVSPAPSHKQYGRHVMCLVILSIATWMGSSTGAVAKTSKPWSGSAAFGFSSVTGTFPSLNLHSDDWIRWRKYHWENRAHMSYNYTAASATIYANRLVLGNQTRYYFKPKIHYVFGDIRYDRNQFNGYFYHLIEIIGEGNIIHLNRTMSIDYQGGIGAQEDHPIGRKSQVNPAARLAVSYEWHLTRHADFKEALTTLLSTANNNTYESVTSVQSRLYGNFSLQFSYTATYNEFTAISYYKKFNTITAADLMYHF